MKKTYKIKNYKGNIIESLDRFNNIYAYRYRIVEASENDNNGLDVTVDNAPEKNMNEGFQKTMAWFFGALYLMSDEDFNKTAKDAIENKKKVDAALEKENIALTESTQIDEGFKDFLKGLKNFAKSFAFGTLKLGAFNILAGAMGASPYLVTIIGNIIFGIISDARSSKNRKKIIKNIAKRALTGTAFTLFSQMIGAAAFGNGYETGTLTGSEVSDMNFWEKAGYAITHGFKTPENTTIKFEVPRNLGAAINEFIPSLAKNKYDVSDGFAKIVDPKNSEHFIYRFEMLSLAIGRTAAKFFEPIAKMFNIPWTIPEA